MAMSPDWVSALKGAVDEAGSLVKAARLICASIEHDGLRSVDVDHVRRNLVNWCGGRWPPDEFYRPHVARALNLPADLFPPARRRGRRHDDDDPVLLIERAIERCWRTDDERGAAAALPEARTHLANGMTLLTRGDVDARRLTRLQRGLAELSRLAGTGEFDRQNYRAARPHYLNGLRLARDTGDRLFEANVLSCMSLQATYEGAETRALALALAAGDLASAHNSPRVHALLAMRAAYAYAATGQTRECHDCLTRAERFLGRAETGTEDPDWATYFDEAKLLADAGIARGRLGEYASAAPLLTEALEANHPGRRRLRAFHLLWMGRVHLGAGELVQACVTASRAAVLSLHLESPRTDQHLIEFNRGLNPYSQERPVRDFRELLLDLRSLQGAWPDDQMAGEFGSSRST